MPPLSPQTSLNKLLETLGKAEPFFIRCIRSNAEKVRAAPPSPGRRKPSPGLETGRECYCVSRGGGVLGVRRVGQESVHLEEASVHTGSEDWRKLVLLPARVPGLVGHVF